MRVNLGCGQAYTDGWVNVDASPAVKADIYMDAAEFVREYGDQVDEVYMGHVLEHILPGDAFVLLRMLNERLRAGTVVSAVTPDMQAIFDAYRSGEVSNDQLNASFIYSYVQPSHHVWCYDEPSLRQLFERAGFDDVTGIDPRTWDPVFHKQGTEAQWQCGVKASAKGRPVPDPADAAADVATITSDGTAQPKPPDAPAPVTPEHLLLHRVQQLREQLLREVARRRELEATLPAPAEAAVPAGLAASPADRAPAPPAALAQPHGAAVSPVDARTAAKMRIKATAAHALPPGSRGRAMARAGVSTIREARTFVHGVRDLWVIPGVIEAGEPAYRKWAKQHDTPANVLVMQRQEAARTSHPVHFLTLVSGAEETSLQQTLASIGEQTWGRTEIVVCSATGALVLPASDDYRELAGSAETVVQRMNEAIIRSDADFVVFLDAGDELGPDCLYHVATTVRRDPLVDLAYWDDDILNARGVRSDPRFRPSWSPEVLLGANYVGHSFAIRRRRVDYAGGLRTGFGDATLWDLLLRSDLDEERVARVSRVLGHVPDRHDAVNADGVRVVAEHLERNGIPASAEAADRCVRVVWQREEWPHVTVIIPTRHNRRMLSTSLPSLRRTDYPSFDVFIVDNGARTAENEQWYEQFTDLDLTVRWWDEPFNYSAVNNAAARDARGEVLLFLNDDTEVLDPRWMRELVGWALQPDIGTVGLQLIGPDGKLQSAGTVLGLNGFADHVFEGMAPGADSLLGPTTWYRDALAVTGACLAVRRDVFDGFGGFDERFILCGSDVALGLDAKLSGRRNVCSPFAPVRHLESATRGTHVPTEDFFASYWRYQTWIFGGDPYYSPSLSLGHRHPTLRAANEPTPHQRISGPLGRSFQVFRQKSDETESFMLADTCRAVPLDVAAVRALHADDREPFEVRTVNWYIPDIDSPFYGGINTALRIADHLGRHHGVENRFIVWGAGPDFFVRSALAAAFPSLAGAEIHFYDRIDAGTLESMPAADASIATLWVTAYAVMHAPNTRRKFYLIQDFEPMFYPASTLYALTEETYRFGLYGLCNTENLHKIYADDYDGRGMSFVPAVDSSVFHAEHRTQRTPDAPATVFVYARPGHWRNCWELASLALSQLKDRLGDRVRIVTAGSWAIPTGGSSATSIKHLGLLDYKATGDLYRTCDVGLALTVSKHPSYLPLELMACGVPVVAYDNPWGHWILEDGENSLLSMRTVDGIAGALERLCVDPELRERMRKRGLADIADRHNSWDAAIAPIYPYLCNPEGH